MTEKIQVKYFDDEIEKLEKISKGDWIDLRAAEDVVMFEGDFKLISLGVGMKLPDGYEAHIVPRSSTFKKWGIIQTNHMGVIDNSYSGDEDCWMFPAFCLKPTGETFVTGKPATLISKGDRICQFRIVKSMPEIEIVEVEHLNESSRGGFGSTGTN